MTLDHEPEPRVYILAFRQNQRTVIVNGTICATRKEAEMLRFDREANGEGFPGEFVHQKVPLWLVRAVNGRSATGNGL